MNTKICIAGLNRRAGYATASRDDLPKAVYIEDKLDIYEKEM